LHVDGYHDGHVRKLEYGQWQKEKIAEVCLLRPPTLTVPTLTTLITGTPLFQTLIS